MPHCLNRIERSLLRLVRSWMMGLEDRKYIGHKDHRLAGLNMETKTLNFFT